MVVAIKKSPQEPERRQAKKTNVVLSLKAPALPRDRNHNRHQARRGLVESFRYQIHASWRKKKKARWKK
jgi:hypothetical protein